MNRLYAVEPMPSPTGARADHRLPLRANDIQEFAWALATNLKVANGPTKGDNADIYKWIPGIGKDLQQNAGASLVIAGDYQPPIVHALAHAMNEKLGNVGKTVFYTDPLEVDPVDQLASLEELVKDLDAGAVELLLILGGNPAFNAPVELGMGDRLQKARMRVHLGLYHDETSQVCQWHLPETHYLETWGDARAFDGTVTLQQPLIQPLYDGRSAVQVLQMLTENPEVSPYSIVKGYWASQHKGADFESWWRRSVHDGFITGSSLPAKTPALRGDAISSSAQKPKLGGKLEVIFRPDPAIYDGRFANNGWLQELPKPITKLTWDNAAIMSPATAHQLGVLKETLDAGYSGVPMVELTYQGRSLRAPVWSQPGQVDGCVVLHLGYGRTKAGRTGTGIGFNPYGLRTANALWNDVGLTAKQTAGSYDIATTQNDHVLDTRRHIIQSGTLAEYLKDPESIHEGAEEPPRGLTIYPEWQYPGYAWGMAIT